MDCKYYIGIDIGSTASKVVVTDNEKLLDSFCMPTGWNSKETSKAIMQKLKEKGFSEDMACVATGYGRICVDYADKNITEITCHGKGAYALFKVNGTVIDIGGQDTKIITLEDGMVKDFLMNDKCAAGTGKFIEVMANRLGCDFDELYALASSGDALSISSMCTVFAESEVISYIGSGEKRENIAAGVIDSVANKVISLAKKHGIKGEVMLTGGLSFTPYFVELMSKKLDKKIHTHPLGRYAGAIGAALSLRPKQSKPIVFD
jgi:coA-substrate-specific enzyme activase, putative